MKLIILLLFLASIFSCSSPSKIIETTEPKVEVQENEDSTKYELWVLDPQFESWYMVHQRKGYHSIHYYKMWNLRYVTDWNSRYYSGQYHHYFEMPIEYFHHIDYGIEIEEQLYYYFVYVEQELKIPILYAPRHY